ncbi:MAG: 4-hydroxythreonine-4-phosphate dehydrogenase PdxA [Pusillimonas sp.]|nr:4-hydroxythreonine-4-phosphate dehydrogenase PdxA [Pusillimonas sp.]MBC43257.1 4-hydroxythreonine-4-phosphate dehydrogenase PdxA [Pusillimonas sp.]HCP78579.1 4-hydroxythreonine-4-phosphate dehydrogenase PdxA [Pusillimonas sp.]|tara:strand:+ start:1591 stop:2601 length:1011 start_codon:yes stop_codon:yes gene_type:complete
MNAQARPSHKPIGITLGDAAGIGPEIIVKLFSQPLPAPAVVYGDVGVLKRTIEQLALSDAPAVTELDDITSFAPNRNLQVISRIAPLPGSIQAGEISAEAGRGAYEYLCHAIDDANAGHLRAIVTAPLHKEAMQLGGADFPGHTEILAQRTRTRHFAMMLANHELRVILVTIHIPLTQVSASITIDRELQTIRLAHQACRQAGIAQPRIAVAGINPHAGENGRFGQEENEIITPAIQQAQREGMNVTGPFPGDTIFMRARRGEFDIVVAQYHDQGLIPVKYLGVDEGVNVTVGLPFIRTSVDHGTAFDIAGKGLADPGSLRAAFDLAITMTPSETA